MTETEKIAMLKQMTEETDDGILSTYMLLAKNVVLNKAFPFGKYPNEFPERYQTIQIEIAAYMLNKRGAEGEITHSENGVSRSYEDGDIPSSLLRRIIPNAEVLL